MIGVKYDILQSIISEALLYLKSELAGEKIYKSAFTDIVWISLSVDFGLNGPN